MLEEIPLIIADNEAYLDSNEKDNEEIDDINYTEYVPGARWMYSDFRSSNFTKLRILNLLLYSIELITLIYNYHKNINEMHVFFSSLGIFNFSLLFSKNAQCQDLAVKCLSYPYLSLYFFVVFYYMDLGFHSIGDSIFLFLASGYFFNSIHISHCNNIISTLLVKAVILRLSIIYSIVFTDIIIYSYDILDINDPKYGIIITSIFLLIHQSSSLSICCSFSYLYIYFLNANPCIYPMLITSLFISILIMIFT